MRCGHVQERLTLFALDELDAEARARVSAHLAGCAVCSEELASARSFLGSLDAAFAAVSDAAGVEARVMEQVARTPLPTRVRKRDVPPVPLAEDEAEHHVKRRTTAQLIAAAAVILLVIAVWQLSPPAASAGARVEKLAYQVTVYNDDLALVRDVRRVSNLRAGENRVELDDVPTRIDPTSVTFRSRTDPDGTTVLDQNYEYDLATADKILAKYVDRPVEVITKTGDVIAGHLAGHDAGQLVLTAKPGEGDTRIVSRAEVGRIVFDRLPEGLLTRPTLVWKVHANQAGAHETEVSYLTGGMAWQCNYVLVKRPADRADLKAWVTITNRSGASFPQAGLKLMAGDVNLIRDEITVSRAELALDEAEDGEAQAGFQEKSFFEYHLYTLGRKTDLADKCVKQIELSRAADFGTSTRYVLDGGPKVAVYLQFRNTEANGLGVPMPKGVVRVMQEDDDGSLEFIGEDRIDHTSKDEEVKVLTGYAFDLVGERTITADQSISTRARRRIIRVRLRNHKTTPVTITVREHVPHTWRITKTTHEFRKEDAHTVEFDVPVPPDTESVLTFTCEMTW